MADIIRALAEAADKLGLYVVVILASLVMLGVVLSAAIYVGKWNARLVEQVLKAQQVSHDLSQKIQILASETIGHNTRASDANTESNKKLTQAVEQLIETFAAETKCRYETAMTHDRK